MWSLALKGTFVSHPSSKALGLQEEGTERFIRTRSKGWRDGPAEKSAFCSPLTEDLGSVPST